ncbi:MAG: sterol desaturase family protein [Planctomyces sp.]
MTAAQNQNPASDTTWNHSTPVVFSPLFAWPPRPKAALLTLTQRWFTLSRSVLFLAMAVLVHKYLLPVSEQMKSLAGSWVALVFLSNFLFMLIIAGSLHLFLFTFRLQGKQLKYDHRESHELSRKFTFHSQVRDNMFWSLVSGSTIWSIYEMLYFHGVARGAIPTVTLTEHPFAFVLWLLAMPIITSSHFYATHRLLHWPPLYRTVHRLHHRNIHIGPWSGMAMHPVEHAFYISSVLIHFIIQSHPVILLMHLYGR